MSIEVGSVVEGKVSGIMPFGAFVSFDDDKTGLVHISEVAEKYVENINEHLKVGDVVKAKVIKIDEKGKISLSIKKAIEKPRNNKKNFNSRTKTSKSCRPDDFEWGTQKDQELSFEDKLSQFKKISDEKMLDLKHSMDSKRSGGYKRGSY